MSKFLPQKMLSFIRNESGASMVEYGVAIVVITSIGVVAMTTLGGETRASVDTACAALNEADSC